MQQCGRVLARALSDLNHDSHIATFLQRRLYPPAPCRQFTDSTSPRHGCTSLSASLSTFWSRLDQCGLTLSQARRWPKESNLPQAPSKRFAHSASNSKWLARQSSDRFSREAKVANLKSRAAFKLLQINERYHIFRPGLTVVDLGFAPGSWSQVAIDLVKPGVGRVVGVDVIPAQPPKGVNSMQGNFLSPDVQARVREFLQDESAGKMRVHNSADETIALADDTSYIDRERALTESDGAGKEQEMRGTKQNTQVQRNRCVDVVLSDMSAPWEIFSGLCINSISNPYRRMMNTTGNKFRDHAGSMDLCRSALYFCYDNLKVGGSFVCKFYQGAEDKALERQLRALFHKVHREKPESSRSESRESFFVCLKRLADADRIKVFDEN